MRHYSAIRRQYMLTKEPSHSSSFYFKWYINRQANRSVQKNKIVLDYFDGEPQYCCVTNCVDREGRWNVMLTVWQSHCTLYTAHCTLHCTRGKQRICGSQWLKTKGISSLNLAWRCLRQGNCCDFRLVNQWETAGWSVVAALHSPAAPDPVCRLPLLAQISPARPRLSRCRHPGNISGHVCPLPHSQLRSAWKTCLAMK